MYRIGIFNSENKFFGKQKGCASLRGKKYNG